VDVQGSRRAPRLKVKAGGIHGYQEFRSCCALVKQVDSVRRKARP